jgi:hypothetical protein
VKLPGIGLAGFLGVSLLPARPGFVLRPRVPGTIHARKGRTSIATGNRHTGQPHRHARERERRERQARDA